MEILSVLQPLTGFYRVTDEYSVILHMKLVITSDFSVACFSFSTLIAAIAFTACKCPPKIMVFKIQGINSQIKMSKNVQNGEHQVLFETTTKSFISFQLLWRLSR